MSLVLSSDVYLQGTGGSFGSSATKRTIAMWIKATSTARFHMGFQIGRSGQAQLDSMLIAGWSDDTYRGYHGPSGSTSGGGGGTVTTAWKHVCLVFDTPGTNNVKLYVNGSNVWTDSNASSFSSSTIDKVKIGDDFWFGGSFYSRARYAHCAHWHNVALSSTEVGELYNGGSGGGGKNPQAVQNAALNFYASLLTDATVTVGGISLTALTGAEGSQVGATASYDSDNPTVDTYGASVVVSSAGDGTFQNGEAGIVIAGTGFGASQGAGFVKISPTDDIDDASAVSQTITNWSDTSITITAVKGSLALNTNMYLFVEENGGTSNASGTVVQFWDAGSPIVSYVRPIVFVTDTIIQY